jgi:hypothetical protein
MSLPRLRQQPLRPRRRLPARLIGLRDLEIVRPYQAEVRKRPFGKFLQLAGGATEPVSAVAVSKCVVHTATARQDLCLARSGDPDPRSSWGQDAEGSKKED